MKKNTTNNLLEKEEKLKTFAGTAQDGLEPDYELLKRHLESWATSHPDKMKSFLEYRKALINSNVKDTGAFKDNSGRRLLIMPPELYRLFIILAPNFVGGEELTPESQIKRARQFIKEFPVFKAHKKT